MQAQVEYARPKQGPSIICQAEYAGPSRVGKVQVDFAGLTTNNLNGDNFPFPKRFLVECNSQAKQPVGTTILQI